MQSIVRLLIIKVKKRTSIIFVIVGFKEYYKQKNPEILYVNAVSQIKVVKSITKIDFVQYLKRKRLFMIHAAEENKVLK